MPTEFAVSILAPVAWQCRLMLSARMAAALAGKAACVVCMAVHEGRWLFGGHAEGMQPLLSCQLTRVSRHRLDCQDKDQRREGTALEGPRLDRDAVCQLLKRLWLSCLHAGGLPMAPAPNPTAAMHRSHPGPVQLIDRHLEVQEEKDPWLCRWKSMAKQLPLSYVLCHMLWT